MSVEINKEVVRGYFAEVVDKFNIDLLGEYYTDDCIIHRPEVPEPVIGIENFKAGLARVIDSYSSIRTTIHDLFGAGDLRPKPHSVLIPNGVLYFFATSIRVFVPSTPSVR